MPVPNARQHLDECKILSLCRYCLLIFKVKESSAGVFGACGSIGHA